MTTSASSSGRDPRAPDLPGIVGARPTEVPAPEVCRRGDVAETEGARVIASPWVLLCVLGPALVVTTYVVAGADAGVAAFLVLLVAALVLAAKQRRPTPASKASPTRPELGPEEPPDGDEVYEVPIQESIDLHFFAPRDVPSVVDEYLREASKRGFEEVRLIHGRGKGVQRAKVQKILTRHPAVASFRSDGTGSTLASLRPRARRPPARR